MENVKVWINGFEYSYLKEDLLKIPFFQAQGKYNKDFKNGKEIKIYNQNISPNSLNDLIDYIKGNTQLVNSDPFYDEKIRIAACFYGYNLSLDKCNPKMGDQKPPTRLFM